MYQSLEARLHDDFWNAEDGPGELELLRAFHELHPGPALELGCGSGRLLLPLLASGLPIEGVDLSPEMLALCRERARALQLEPVLHETNIGQLSLGRAFATITIPAFTIQLVPDPAPVLAAIREHLLPGGWLYLSAFVPHAELEEELPQDEWYPDRDLTLPDQTRALVETKHHLDPATRSLLRHHRYALHRPDGGLLESHACSEQIHWLEPDELEALLADHGLIVTDAIANFDPGDDCPLEEATVFTFFARRTPDSQLPTPNS